MGPTKDQQRAKFAWEKVTEAERLFGENFEKYVNFSKSAPTPGYVQRPHVGRGPSSKAGRRTRPNHSWPRFADGWAPKRL